MCWVSLLLLVLLASPGASGAERAAPDPESVYRQLRHDPVIKTRKQAIEYLAKTSPDDLRRSAKLCVDRRIKILLQHEFFGSLDRETQDALHTSMLKIRSSFWQGDPDELADGGGALRQILDSGRIPPAADQDTPEGEFRECVAELLSEVETAQVLLECTRARQLHDWDAARQLDCVLKGGPAD
jgi:hypothetical protein